MIFSKIIGHKEIIASLLKTLRENERLPPAFLFSGPSGVGKKLVARGWAQGLLCQEKIKPCGKCSSCLRVETSHHSDLHIVSNSDSANIKIEQIRQLQNSLALRAFEGHSKIAIIDQAHSMTNQGANSLLKTLEEPPAHCYFILVTSNKGALPITIQSRCQNIMFGSLGRSEISQIVSTAEDWALRLSQGRVDLAQQFTDETYRNLRKSALVALRDLPISRVYEGFNKMGELSEDRDTALFTIQCWMQVIKNAVASQLHSPLALAPDEIEIIELLAKKFSSVALLSMGQRLFRLEQDVQSNVNKTLAFEKFWIDTKSTLTMGETN